jgi:ABC-type transport system involved in multi-copper enzyme maturation permease subunit
VTAVIRSELLKVRTTRGWYGYLAVIVVLVGIGVAGDIGSTDDFVRGGLSYQVGLIETAGFAGVIAAILGITMVTAEFRHGTITPTLLATPRRERMLAGKTVAAAVLGAGFALLALATLVVVAVTWLSLVGAELHLGDPEVLKRMGQIVLVSVLWALLGIAIGAAVHGQVAALVGTLVWIFVVENLLVGLLGLLDNDGVAAYLPFRALDAADGTGGDNLIAYWPGVGVSLAWIAAIGAFGVVRTRRRDIT